MERIISAFGIIVILGIAWLWSSDRRAISWRTVAWGVGLQLIFATLVIAFPLGVEVFRRIGDGVGWFLGFANEGAVFLFGDIASVEKRSVFGFQFALTIMPIIVFFSAFIAALYHFGIVQRVVRAMAWVMQRTMKTSAIESLSAAANVFLGQTEAPLIVRHYIASASTSELFALMVGGFATIAGSTMGVYIAMGIPANYLIIASLLAAPGGLALAKMAMPMAARHQPSIVQEADPTGQGANVIDAIARGALDGFKISVNVIVVLLAFKSLVALTDATLALASLRSLDTYLGYAFYPLAWLTGVPQHEVQTFASLLGVKISQTEFLAYEKLSMLVNTGALSQRTVTIATVGLCGFANILSIGIQIGGFGIMAPERRGDVARMGFKAMCIGALANLLAACVVGLFV